LRHLRFDGDIELHEMGCFNPELSLETEMAFMGRHIEVSAQGYRARFEKAISYVYPSIIYK
jgi:hypothetical protein